MSDIIVAPFSNSDIRDWPAAHFATMIGLLADRWDGPGRIRVIGTRNQWTRAAAIVRGHDPQRVANECGRLAWPEVERLIETAACVIGNNSGIAHLAAMYDVPTVCIFGGSHQRLEWRPIGFSVDVLTHTIACSPCHLDHGRSCPYDKACLQRIEPELVAERAQAVMARGEAAGLLETA